jgi:LysR family transcriptional regulator, low CO2-responsive transcriptional regulator
MNLSQLRAFNAVVRTGSFTAAARLLGVSQPAVTAHVRQLEGYYEVDLIRRQGRVSVATQIGEQLAQISRELFHFEEQAVDLLSAHKRLKTGTVYIAADGPYAAVPLVAEFQRRHPGVHMNLWIGTTEDVERAVLEERFDIGILGHVGADERLHRVALGSEAIIVFVHEAHAWAKSGRESVDISELAGLPIIVRERGSTTRLRFDGACKAAGLAPDYVIETTSRETLKEAVAAGLGVGVIAATELRNEDRFWPLHVSGADMGFTEEVVCVKRRMDLRLVREFLWIAQHSA